MFKLLYILTTKCSHATSITTKIHNISTSPQNSRVPVAQYSARYSLGTNLVSVPTGLFFPHRNRNGIT